MKNQKKNGFYIKKDFLNEFQCPVCRQLLTDNILTKVDTSNNDDQQCSDDDDNNSSIIIKKLSPKIKLWQQEMETLYQKQKEKGGIIDLQKTDIVFS